MSCSVDGRGGVPGSVSHAIVAILLHMGPPGFCNVLLCSMLCSLIRSFSHSTIRLILHLMHVHLPPRTMHTIGVTVIALVAGLIDAHVRGCAAFMPPSSADASLRSSLASTGRTSRLAMASSSTSTTESNPRMLVNEGMERFRRGDVEGSIELFDVAEKNLPQLRPYLWQRGLSYYYADRFQEGSDQFKIDVSVNPLDTEEVVWDIACQLRLTNGDLTRVSKMSLPRGKTDRRRIMATIYSLFRGDGATEHDLLLAGQSGSKSDEFYSLYYLGLYCEAKGETSKAEMYLLQSIKTDYGRGSNDYMTSCAKVHCKLRGWV